MAHRNLPKSNFNLVEIDGILKEQIQKEYITRKKWDEKWGFLKNFDKICVEIAREKGITEEKYRRMTIKRKGPRLPDVSTWETVSSGPVPRTTSAEVGWRSGKPECSLEKMGPLYISPKHTIEPPDAEPSWPIYNIFLG